MTSNGLKLGLGWICALALAATACHEENQGEWDASPDQVASFDAADEERDAATDASTEVDGGSGDLTGEGATDSAVDGGAPVDGGSVAATLRLAAGYGSSCLILASGQLKCWGSNFSGRLGLGDTEARGDQPNEMGANLAVVNVGAGRTVKNVTIGNRHACAVLDNNRVKCWGLNSDGQLGLQDNIDRGDAPGEMGDALPYVDLGTGRTAHLLAAGQHHTCAILDNDKVKCWGQNIHGELGLGDTFERGGSAGEMGDALPYVDLGAGRTAKALTAGEGSSCAILDDDQIKCWGYNTYGQAGLGNTSSRGDNANEMGDNLPSVDLGPGRHALMVSTYTYHTCALLDDGSVKCWGYNHGELGVGESGNDRGDQPNEMGANLPVIDLGVGRTAKAIAVGEQSSCALLSDGSIKCWGGNQYGQLGLGDTNARGDTIGEMGDNLPIVDLGPGAVATQLVAGATFNCAVLSSAVVKCWGVNGGGQLGLGDTAQRGDDAGEMGANLPALALP